MPTDGAGVGCPIPLASEPEQAPDTGAERLLVPNLPLPGLGSSLVPLLS